MVGCVPLHLTAMLFSCYFKAPKVEQAKVGGDADFANAAATGRQPRDVRASLFERSEFAEAA